MSLIFIVSALLRLFLVTLNQPARVLGFFLSGAISDKIGRKRSLIVVSVFQIISSLTMYFVNSYTTLMVNLCVSGIAMSMVMIPSYALLSEICLIRFRSSLASLNTSNANLGWLGGLCLGLIIPVQYYTSILCFPSVIFLLLCWKMPESPMYELFCYQSLLSYSGSVQVVDEGGKREGGKTDFAVAQRK